MKSISLPLCLVALASLTAAPAAFAGITTTTSLSLSPASVVYGAGTSVTYTVTVTDASGGRPAGSVTITAAGITGTLATIAVGAPATDATCSNASATSRTCTGTGTIPVGTAVNADYTVTATYTPTSGAFNSSSGTAALAVTQATPTAAFATPTAAYGATVTLSATDTGVAGATAPTGTATFTVNGATAPGTTTCNSSGVVETCTLSYTYPASISTGSSVTFSVTFAASTDYKSATASGGPVTVGLGTATVAVTSVSTTYEKAVTLTETETGAGPGYAAPTGIPTVTVTTTGATVTQGRTKTCTDSGHVETCSALFSSRSTEPVGTYTITASFPADSNYNAASNTGTLTVSEDDSKTVVTATPSNLTAPSASTTLLAKVTNTGHKPDYPSGTVTFNDGAGSCTLATVNKVASCSVSVTGTTLGSGESHTVTATYGGVTNEIATSTGSVTVTVGADIVFTSVTHNFGTVPLGSTATYGVQLTNNDSTAFPFSLTLSGSSKFTSATNCGSSLAAAKSCEIVFTYTPTAAGETDTAAWTLASDGLTFSPSDGGTLTGTAVAAAGVTLTTPGHDFGQQELTTTSDVYGTVLTNGTASAITLAFTQTDSTDFITYADNCTATLAAYQSCELQYYFAPTQTGFLEDFVGITATQGGSPVTITSDGNTVTGITLDGYGVAADTR